MATRVYKSGNYLIIDDGTDIKEIPAKDCAYDVNGSDYTIIDSIKGFNTKVIPFSEIRDESNTSYSSEAVFLSFLRENTSSDSASGSLAGGGGLVSTLNSTSTLLTNGNIFTGAWENVSAYDSVVVAVKTDQNGIYTIEFSPDGINQDSTLTRYYRTDQIEAPHRFTITRSYCRVRFSNNSGSDQTYLRLQTTYGNKTELNIPLDAVLSQDFDSLSVRPSDYKYEVAGGLRQGSTIWNKFGYNDDIDSGTEVVASFGGTFTPLTTPTTISIASTSGNDIVTTGSGVQSLVIYGVDANRDEQIEVVSMNGLTPVVTTSTWLGINRIAMFLCGTSQGNEGLITATAVTGGSTMAQMPIGGGVTQQCIFHIPRKHQFNAKPLWVNVLNRGKNAELLLKMWVYSPVNNGKQEVFRLGIDTQQVTAPIVFDPELPFPVSEKSVMWLECTSSANDVSVNARFSGILERNKDA